MADARVAVIVGQHGILNAELLRRPQYGHLAVKFASNGGQGRAGLHAMIGFGG